MLILAYPVGLILTGRLLADLMLQGETEATFIFVYFFKYWTRAREGVEEGAGNSSYSYILAYPNLRDERREQLKTLIERHRYFALQL